MNKLAVAVSTITMFGAPNIALADPIEFDGPFVSRWVNDQGIFDATIGGAFAGMGDPGTSSFSDGVYEFFADSLAFSRDQAITDVVRLDSVAVNIKLAVESNGTESGHLRSGTLHVVASSNYDKLGITSGDLLLTGTAIEAAALNNISRGGAFATQALFRVDFALPIFEYTGQFLSFGDPNPSTYSWGSDASSALSPFLPWNRNWGPSRGPLSYRLHAAVRVPEPGTLPLFAIGLLGLALVRKK